MRTELISDSVRDASGTIYISYNQRTVVAEDRWLWLAWVLVVVHGWTWP